MLLLEEKNHSFFEVFETKVGGEGGGYFSVVSKRQNMSEFFFASIIKLGHIVFRLFINDPLDELNISNLGATIGRFKIAALGFADDIFLISYILVSSIIC